MITSRCWSTLWSPQIALAILLAAMHVLSAQRAAAADGRRVHGVLVDETGGAVADAEVLLLRSGGSGGASVPTKVHSDAAGRFAFDGLEAGEYRLWAFAGNLTSRDKRREGQIITIPATAETQPVKLVMRLGRIVRATVTAADGSPISGAKLRLMWSDTYTEYFTDDSGVIVIEALTPEPWQIEATADAKAKLVKMLNLSAAAETTVEFVLPDGGHISGTVRDAAGAPVPAAGINAYRHGEGTPTHYVEAEADGWFRVDHLPLDEPLQLSFSHARFIDRNERLTLTAAEREAHLDVTLEPKIFGTIAGRVVDGSAKPVPDARVNFHGRSTADEKTVTVDDAGRFRFDDIPLSEQFPHRLVARAKGWAPLVQEVHVTAPGPPVDVVLQLVEPGHSIAGRVVDKNDEPIQGAWVDAGGRTLPNLVGGRSITNEQGRFSFDSLPASITFEITARGYSDLTNKTLPLDRDDVKIVLVEEGAIAGRVTDADTQQPITQFNTKLRFAPRHRSAGASLDTIRAQQGEEFSSATGEFRLSDLVADVPLVLVVTAEGYPPHHFEVVPTPGGEGQWHELAISKQPPEALRVAGRIVTAAGEPIAGAQVRAVAYAVDAQAPERRIFSWQMLHSGQLEIQGYIRSIDSATTDNHGAFAFPAVMGAEVDLAYWGDGVPQTRLKNLRQLPDEQRANLLIEVPPPATIRGRINREAYAVVDHLLLRSPSDRDVEAQVKIKADQNEYIISNLQSGAYELLLAGEPVYGSDRTFRYAYVGVVNVELEEGQTQQVDLGFEPARTVSGTITIAGKPLAEGHVALYFGDRRRLGTRLLTRTDSAGRFKFNHVPPDVYDLVPLGEAKGLSAFQENYIHERIAVDDEDVQRDFDFADIAHPTPRPHLRP